MINLGSPLTGDEAEETLASDKIKRLELKLKLSDENFDLVNKELLTALKKNVRLESQLEEATAILKDFITTKECRETWIAEMHGTINAVIEELEGGSDE